MNDILDLSPQERGDARIDSDTASVVERGIEFYKTLGKTVATAYLREQRVPEAVARRILDQSRARRAPPPEPPPRFYG
jgi:hypothetical protein